ncbi:hypothetical protein [Bradyrhizobium sp. BRP56]|uniref:hypothetical protein n=1 Tax=Bradyrhizobium sp. BRP56 TaxID=2793819 RepID=UPI00320958B4|nr:hypothetical protein [Bradyrhizobium sp. BRP56]
MAKLDDAWGAQAILYLRWNNDEAQEWKATWQPKTIGPKGEEGQPGSLSEPVEEALKRLTGMINLSTGLSHPLDIAESWASKYSSISLTALCSHSSACVSNETRWSGRNAAA